MPHRSILLFCILGLIVESNAFAQVTVTRIADTATVVPGESFTFDGFGGVSIDGDTVVFNGRTNSGYEGVFTSTAGTLTGIADSSDAAPGTAGNFTTFLNTWSDSGSVAFTALDVNNDSGVYRFDSNGISLVANSSVNYPGGFGNFEFVDSVSISNTGTIGFEGGTNFSNTGVYSHKGTTLTEIANESTAIPGGSGNFTGFSSVRTRGDDVVFQGTGNSNQTGIYESSGGTISAVIDSTNTVPGSSEQFAFFQGVSVDGNQTLFLGGGTTSGGIYISENGTLATVVDTTTLIPGTGETFTTLTSPAIDDGNVAFFGGGATTPVSLFYQESGGDLQMLVSEGDMLDGRTIQLLLIANDSIDGNSVVTHTIFTDGSRGVYRFDIARSIPEPTYLGLLLLTVACVRRRSIPGRIRP